MSDIIPKKIVKSTITARPLYWVLSPPLREVYGFCEPALDTIVISDDLDASKAWGTILHEAIHMVFIECGLRSNEPDVSPVAAILEQTLAPFLPKGNAKELFARADVRTNKKHKKRTKK